MELSEDGFNKLVHRVMKRDKLLHGVRVDKIPRYADNVLDAAIEVLEPTGSLYTEWPELPYTSTISLEYNAEVSLLDQLSAAVNSERVTATFACGGEIPIDGH